MNAVPIRISTDIQDERERLDEVLAAHRALVESGTESLRRTRAIVDRLCPEIPLPSFSTRYAELNSPASVWERYHDAVSRRKALYRQIKPLMDAKINAARWRLLDRGRA